MKRYTNLVIVWWSLSQFKRWQCSYKCFWFQDALSVNQKAKVKPTVIEIWRNMTVKELADSMGKSVGRKKSPNLVIWLEITNIILQVTFLKCLSMWKTLRRTQSPIPWSTTSKSSRKQPKNPVLDLKSWHTRAKGSCRVCPSTKMQKKGQYPFPPKWP